LTQNHASHLLGHIHAGSPTNTGTSSDEIAQRFAGFFFRVLATEPEKVGVLFLRVLVRAMPRSGIPTTGTTLPGLQLRRALRCQRCGATPPGRAGASTGEPQARESAVREDRDRAVPESSSESEVGPGPEEEEEEEEFIRIQWIL